jgi:ankyrin repeat protein
MGQTALNIASENGHWAAVEALCNYGASVNEKDEVRVDCYILTSI